MTYKRESATTGRDIVNLFARHFNSVYNNDVAVLDNINSYPNSILETFSFTYEDTSVKFSNLRDSLSSGHNGIGVSFIKELWHLLVEPLLYFYNNSIEISFFHTFRGKTYILPIYNKVL